MWNDTSRTGAAATRRTGKRNLLLLLIQLMEEDSTADKERLFLGWRGQIIDNPEDVDTALYHCFTNLFRVVELQKPGKPSSKSYTTEERETRVEEIKNRIIRQVLTLDFIMPNGKQLADCTGLEVKKYGMIFEAIGMHAGKRLIRDVFKTNEALLTWRRKIE